MKKMQNTLQTSEEDAKYTPNEWRTPSQYIYVFYELLICTSPSSFVFLKRMSVRDPTNVREYKMVKLHSTRVENLYNYTRNEWRTTLEMGEEYGNLHSKRV